ncbi:CPK2 [Symbiodinium microadriaticum]|nr:CPK2 [Symbiodinium microadriaticum]CAE7734453.1 CPK2 [Symbiodinium sp. KB8]
MAEGFTEDDLEKTDALLPHVEKRIRMSVCMEIVRTYAKDQDQQVRSIVDDLADELSEFSAKNYIFHSWLANCYHSIRQHEVRAYGQQELSAPRRASLLRLPGPLRLSSGQLEVLNELLREEGALEPEVEILGVKLSSVGVRAAVAAAGLAAIGFAAVAWRLLRSGTTSQASSDRAKKPKLEGSFNGNRKLHGAGQSGARAPAPTSSEQIIAEKRGCENILLKHMDLPVEENIFKLCDFGFAAHDKGDGLNDRLGSPDTVAPEIVVGTKYSMPVDMWSAGVLIYMMLSAAPPFYATTDSEVLRKVRTGSYNLSGEPWDSLPAPPKNLIASLMTVDPKLRPTADQALNCEWLR